MPTKKSGQSGPQADIPAGTGTTRADSLPAQNSPQGMEDHQKGDFAAGAPPAAKPAAAPKGSGPVLEIDAAKLSTQRAVLPPGTLVVVNSAAQPTTIPARTYDFPPPPATDVAPAGAHAPAVVQPRVYQFPAGDPQASISAQEIAPGLTPRAHWFSAAPAASLGVSQPAIAGQAVPATSTATANPGVETAGQSPIATAADTSGSASIAKPSIPTPPTLIVPPTLAGGSAASASAPAESTTADPSAPATNVMAPPAATVPAGGGAQSQGSGLVVSDILRLAAQFSAERSAAVDPAEQAKEDFKIDPAKVKDLSDRLFKETEDLYQKISATVNDSPAVAAYCLDLLKKARVDLLNGQTAGELSQAEYYIEEVRAKLGRSQDPIPRGEKRYVAAIILWSVVFWLLCLPLALLPWLAPTGALPNWNIKLPIDVIPLLATVGWGGIGGVIGTLYNMTWFVKMREYDPAYNLDYLVRPIKGFIAGGVMMLIFTTGVATLSGPQAPASADKASIGYALVYLFAALAGFKQEYVYEWFDSLLKIVFRTPPATPRQLDPNAQ